MPALIIRDREDKEFVFIIVTKSTSLMLFQSSNGMLVKMTSVAVILIEPCCVTRAESRMHVYIGDKMRNQVFEFNMSDGTVVCEIGKGYALSHSISLCLSGPELLVFDGNDRQKLGFDVCSGNISRVVCNSKLPLNGAWGIAL